MTISALMDPELMIVFAQATTGLGHLRVTEALYEALPHKVHSVFLTSQTVSDTVLYRIISTNPILTSLMEYGQSGWREDAFLPLMNGSFRLGLGTLEKQLAHIISQQYHTPKTLLVVATHHRPAYQIGLIKKAFEKKYGITIVIVVVVTDDSPQKVWAVPRTDIIFVPSINTKIALEHNMRQKRQAGKFCISPYIVSPKLTVTLGTEKRNDRLLQYSPDGSHTPVFSIPVSGAAVQLPYLAEIIQSIHTIWHTAQFHIATVDSKYSRTFLRNLTHIPTVYSRASVSPRETIALYEYLFTERVVGFEITKPSEQAFKAMIPPTDNGGIILLFSEPVGRQEYDNLEFLRRHGLIPSASEQDALWRMADTKNSASSELKKTARNWRGIRLPQNPRHAVACIVTWMSEGFFDEMGHFRGYPVSAEISKEGAKLFWGRVSEFLGTGKITDTHAKNA